MVGEEGFEPPTLWSQTRCATKLRYSPTNVSFLEKNGVANGIRTRDNRNHNPGLYQLSYSHHQIVMFIAYLSHKPEPRLKQNPNNSGR